MGSDGFGSLEHRGASMLRCDGPVDRGCLPGGQTINHELAAVFPDFEDFFRP